MKVSEIVQDYEQLALFQEDFPANLFPWLESKKVKRTTVICGRKCLELSENLRRLGLLVRMYLESCELPGKQFVRTWSVKDTLSPYLILKLRLSERRIDEKECSLWLTPNAMDSLNPREPEALMKQMEKNRPGRTTLSTLREQVAYEGLWPTPTGTERSGINPNTGKGAGLSKAVQMWPTPTTVNRNSRNAIMKIGEPHKNHGAALGLEQVAELAEGQLPKEFNSIEEVPEYYTKFLPTPTARDWKGARTPEKLKEVGRNATNSLPDAIRQEQSGQLNPTWVEGLMGFPLGWTEI